MIEIKKKKVSRQYVDAILMTCVLNFMPSEII